MHVRTARLSEPRRKSAATKADRVKRPSQERTDEAFSVLHGRNLPLQVYRHPAMGDHVGELLWDAEFYYGCRVFRSPSLSCWHSSTIELAGQSIFGRVMSMATFGNSDRSTEESSRSAVSWAAIVAAAAAASGLTIVIATLGSGLDSRRSHLG
jgi:hypothetical protein